MSNYFRQAAIVATLMLAAGLSSCSFSSLKNKDAKIEVGKYYLYSNYWDNEDPFEVILIDTVKVVAISGEYVKWEYKKGFFLSGKLKYFKHRQRAFN